MVTKVIGGKKYTIDSDPHALQASIYDLAHELGIDVGEKNKFIDGKIGPKTIAALEEVLSSDQIKHPQINEFREAVNNGVLSQNLALFVSDAAADIQVDAKARIDGFKANAAAAKLPAPLTELQNAIAAKMKERNPLFDPNKYALDRVPKVPEYFQHQLKTEGKIEFEYQGRTQTIALGEDGHFSTKELQLLADRTIDGTLKQEAKRFEREHRESEKAQVEANRHNEPQRPGAQPANPATEMFDKDTAKIEQRLQETRRGLVDGVERAVEEQAGGGLASKLSINVPPSVREALVKHGVAKYTMSGEEVTVDLRVKEPDQLKKELQELAGVVKAHNGREGVTNLPDTDLGGIDASKAAARMDNLTTALGAKR